MSTPMLPRAAVCRWCHARIPIPSRGICPSNTRGCGDRCGFYCSPTCSPATWTYGLHEPTVMGYSITHEKDKPVFVLIDEDRRRAIEWRYVESHPVEIVHDASPRPGAEEPVGCLHIPGFCFPRAAALPLGLATLYRQAGETFDPGVHEQVHAAMGLRWAIG